MLPAADSTRVRSRYINTYSRTQLYLPLVLPEDCCYLLSATDSTTVNLSQLLQ